MDTKPTNPKDLIGSDKLPLHLWPETATAMGCLGLLDGALKYGRSNYRAIGVRASIYYDACRRHLNKWFEGEDVDPDSGLPHLAHALACLAILVDAKAAGKLNDDRQYPGGYTKLISDLTPHVKRLKVKYGDREAPKHYTRGESTLYSPSDPAAKEAIKEAMLKKLKDYFETQAKISAASRAFKPVYPCNDCKGMTTLASGACDGSCNRGYGHGV